MKKIFELLEDFRFTELYLELKKLPTQEMDDILNQLAYNPDTDTVNLLVYTFLLFICCKEQSFHLQLTISKLMATTLNHIDSAEKIAFYHGMEALKLSPESIEIKEYLLYFNHLPEKIMKDSLALKLAQDIIKERPDSKAAKLTLSKLI